jgi:hypothetical protein
MIIEALHLLAMSSARRNQYAMAVQYEQDILSLRALIGTEIPHERYLEIVKTVASQAPHENHSGPSHLAALLKDKWYMEGLPKSLSYQSLLDEFAQHSFEWCPDGCLAKFLALIESGIADK